jgi:hypothetical protein
LAYEHIDQSTTPRSGPAYGREFLLGPRPSEQTASSKASAKRRRGGASASGKAIDLGGYAARQPGLIDMMLLGGFGMAR